MKSFSAGAAGCRAAGRVSLVGAAPSPRGAAGAQQDWRAGRLAAAGRARAPVAYARARGSEDAAGAPRAAVE
eukprot:758304-Pyramimonas_sp.AAC.1